MHESSNDAAGQSGASVDGERMAQQVESACVRLASLAVKLGETFMASDLTALLALKKRTGGGPRATDSKALQARVELDEQKPLNKNILEFRNSKGYVIKTIILSILASISEKADADKYFDPPINLILTELVAARKNRFLIDDEQYRFRLFHVLAAYANKVEGQVLKVFLFLALNFVLLQIISYPPIEFSGITCRSCSVRNQSCERSEEAGLVSVSNALSTCCCS